MRFFGHPIHPMLVHFPIVFWTVAVGAYAIDLSGMFEMAAAVAKLSNGAGLLMAIPAMAAGLLELRSLDVKSKAMQVAIWHMMVMGAAWTCFLMALLLPPSMAANPTLAKLGVTASAGVGFILMAIGGWLGGRLVYEFGVAVTARAKP